MPNNDTIIDHGAVKQLAKAFEALASGDASVRLDGSFVGVEASLVKAFNAAAQTQGLPDIRTSSSTLGREVRRRWLEATLVKFNRMLQGHKDLQTLGKMIFTGLASMVSADHAIFYVFEENTGSGKLKYVAGYSLCHDCQGFQRSLKLGEGRVGQCALEKKNLFFEEPISGCLKSEGPLSIMVLPVFFDGQLKAVIEFASVTGFESSEREMLGGLSESLGIVLHAIDSDLQTQDLLKKSQTLAGELQKQQLLLQQQNRLLEEKASLLALQKSEMEKKNREIEQARQALQDKAVQLELTSKYKSEFLANMSHELRSPLNSMLLLARQLMENQEQSMTAKQVEFAKIIHGSGHDLLRLINDILDLAKIESGTVTVDVGDLPFWELQDFVEQTFREIAKSRNLDFRVSLDSMLTAAIQTDGKRLEQILKNLLANAFKFTLKGEVSLRVFQAASGWCPTNLSLKRAPSVVAFEVSDTGIGIPPAKQKLIFEAFHQGDGSTNRKFGGTGLGLTISREIARLLGGEIQLRSAEGQGSTFTLYMPSRYQGSPAPENKEGKKMPVEVFLRGEKHSWDDRGKIEAGDRVLLCIEDDVDFAACLLDLAREQGFKGVAATHGDQVMELVRQYKPAAITLDLTLPDIDGWKILERLKEDCTTRHIPVSIISVDEERIRGLRQGAVAFLVKPATRPMLKNMLLKMKSIQSAEKKSLLIVSEGEIAGLSGLAAGGKILKVHGGQAALAALSKRTFNCVVLDLDLPDMSAIHLLKELKQRRLRDLPVVLYSRRELTPKEQHHLRKLELSLLVKNVCSQERLVDQTSLFLHLMIEKLPEADRTVIEGLHCNDTILSGKTAFIVDDDIRNIFALTSLLERHGMQTASAENGHEAIETLEKGAVPDVILMDIMMPGMDGYETMRELRKSKQFASVPIVAVTAKAMREDRIKCLQAGASDYVPKPVDAQQLLATLKMWLHR